MPDEPLSFPAIEVVLDDFGVNEDNTIWVRLRFQDGTDWKLEWSADSAEAHAIFELFSRMSSQAITRVGERGVTITGFTAIEDDE